MVVSKFEGGSVTDPWAGISADKATELFVTNTSDMISRRLPDGTFLYVSPASERLTGYRPEELVGRSVFDFLHPEEVENCRAAYDRLRTEPWLAPFEHRFRRKDGDYRWFEATGVAIRGQDGEVVRELVMVARDVTDRHYLAKALRQSEDRYRRLMEHMREGVGVLDTEGIVSYANPAMCRILDYQDDELRGLSMRDIVAPEEYEHFLGERSQRHLGVNRPYDSVFLTKHGRRAYVSINPEPMFDEAGKYCGSMAIVTDNTESREMRQVLQRERSFAEQLIDTAQVIVLVLDEQARIVSYNRYMETLSSVPLDEARGKSWFDTFIPADDRVAISALFQNAVEGASVSGHVNPIVTRDGRVRQIEWCNATLYDDDGRSIGILSTGQDITDRLQEFEEQREAVVREVHHRIKNHLQGVIGLLRQHANRDLSTAPLLEYAISQISSVALVYGLRGQMRDPDITLCELCRAICGNYMISGEAVCDFLPRDQQVFITERESVSMALVINELLQNACKHGRHEDDTPAVLVRVRRSDDGVRLTLDNRADGLPEGFDFSAGRGVGTGLSLVRSLLPRAGARLSIGAEHGFVRATLDLSSPVIRLRTRSST